MLKIKLNESTKDIHRNTKLMSKLITSLILILIVFGFIMQTYAFSIGEKIVAKAGDDVPTLMKFGDMYILCTFTEVYKNGEKYYGYCLEAKKDGVEVLGDYNLTISKKLNNNAVFSVLKHGYPNKTPKELGVNNRGEAFLATKQAIYTLIYGRSVNSYSGIDSEAGRRTYAAYKRIVENAKKDPYIPIEYKINMKEESDWILSDDSKYLEKEISVNTNMLNGRYKLSLNNNTVNANIITNSKSLDNIDINDNFKLQIPIENLDKTGELELVIRSDYEKEIAYEATPNISTAQKIAIVGVKEKNNISNNLKVDYLKNLTKLQILKRDVKSKIPLKDVVFNIYNEEKELIYENLKTNKEGKIIIEGILPGKYYIKEVSAKDGYELIKEEIEVDIDYGEEKNTIIENKQIEVKKTLPNTGY